MVPINILSKIVRSRSQVALANKTFVTSGILWREQGESSDKYAHRPQSRDRKTEDDNREGTPKELKKSCGPNRDKPKSPTKHGENKQREKLEKDSLKDIKYLAENKQGEGSLFGEIDNSNKYSKGKEPKLSNPRSFETASSLEKKGSDQHMKSSGPSYDTAKFPEENELKKEQTFTTGSPKNNNPKSPNTQEQRVPKQSTLGKREHRQPGCPTNENKYNSGETNEFDVSTSLSRKNMSPQGNEKCIGNNNTQRSYYYGPYKTSYTDESPDDKTVSSKCIKQTRSEHENKSEETFDPCGATKISSKSSCPGSHEIHKKSSCPPLDTQKLCMEKESKKDQNTTCPENYSQKIKKQQDQCPPKQSKLHKCENREPRCPQEENPQSKNHCESKKPSYANLCSGDKISSQNECAKEDKCDHVEKQCRHNPCEVSNKNACPKVKNNECLDEQIQNICPEDACKKEIKIPELSSSCKVDAAKECICNLKNLQSKWEDVVAAQEVGGKGDCPKPKELGGACQEPINRKPRKSNMIYVVLVAILAAVGYYTYNQDFEPEELFLSKEEIKNEVEGDNDDE